MPRVDVIIATHDRNARLERTLAALSRQTYGDFRVIVVDDASPTAVTPCMTAGQAPLEVYRLSENRGPAGARNAAVRLGCGELLAFVDDDVDPAPDWLAAHVQAQDTQPGVVSIGPLLAPRDWDPTPWNWWEASTLLREYARMEAGIYQPTCRQLFTGNAMVPRNAFERVRGFDEELLRAEDIELGFRLQESGAAFTFLPGAKGWHYARRTFASWVRMARHYAVADIHIDARHPGAGWLAMVHEELANRSPIVRVARRAARVPGGEAVALRTGAAAARAAFTAGHRGASNRILSALYDLTYWNATVAARSARSPFVT